MTMCVCVCVRVCVCVCVYVCVTVCLCVCVHPSYETAHIQSTQRPARGAQPAFKPLELCSAALRLANHSALRSVHHPSPDPELLRLFLRVLPEENALDLAANLEVKRAQPVCRTLRASCRLSCRGGGARPTGRSGRTATLV